MSHTPIKKCLLQCLQLTKPRILDLIYMNSIRINWGSGGENLHADCQVTSHRLITILSRSENNSTFSEGLKARNINSY